MTIFDAIKLCQEEDNMTSCDECCWQNNIKCCHYWLSKQIKQKECMYCIEDRIDNERAIENGEILFCSVCGRGL